MCLEDRPISEPNAAGIDVGAREMFVAVPPGRDENPVRVFATFTEDLERLTDWLEQCGVTTVALESTGVYWIPLFEILEQRGIHPCGFRKFWHAFSGNSGTLCCRWPYLVQLKMTGATGDSVQLDESSPLEDSVQDGGC